MWVTKERYAQISGLTMGEIRARIATKWIRGVHYVVDGRVTMINPREVNRWWGKREELDQIEPAEKFKSVGGTAVETTPKRLIDNLHRLR